MKTSILAADGEIDEVAEKAFRDRVRDEVIALIERLDGPLWLAAGGLADALGWVISFNDAIAGADDAAEEELRGIAEIHGWRAGEVAVRLRKERGGVQ
jgi:hypothetical protein